MFSETELVKLWSDGFRHETWKVGQTVVQIYLEESYVHIFVDSYSVTIRVLMIVLYEHII